MVLLMLMLTAIFIALLVFIMNLMVMLTVILMTVLIKFVAGVLLLMVIAPSHFPPALPSSALSPPQTVSHSLWPRGISLQFDLLYPDRQEKRCVVGNIPPL